MCLHSGHQYIFFSKSTDINCSLKTDHDTIFIGKLLVARGTWNPGLEDYIIPQ